MNWPTFEHTCPGDGECCACGVELCPYGEPLHLHHDGCPSCVTASDAWLGTANAIVAATRGCQHRGFTLHFLLCDRSSMIYEIRGPMFPFVHPGGRWFGQFSAADKAAARARFVRFAGPDLDRWAMEHAMTTQRFLAALQINRVTK